MDIAWLEDFLELSECGNFTRAAAARNISQAAFSRRIRALEEWLGTRLVDRTTHPVRLTPEGERFAHEAAGIIAQLGEARARLSHPELGRNARVRISMPHMLALSRFPTWWSSWAAGTTIRAEAAVGSVSDIITDFVSGGSEILICHRGAQLPVLLDPDLFDMHVIEHDRLCPYVSRAHFPDHASGDPARAGKPLPLLLYGRGAYFARLVEHMIEAAPKVFSGPRQMECNIAHTLRECVTRGMGVGWLPRSLVEGGYRTRLAALQERQWQVGLEVVAFRHRRTSGPACRAIWSRIMRMAPRR